MKKQAVIYLKDTGYGERFEKYLREKAAADWIIHYYSEEEQCRNHLESEPVSVLITGDYIDWLGEFSTKEMKVIWLYEQNKDIDESTDDQSGIIRVHRYQSMEAIYDLILPSVDIEADKAEYVAENLGEIKIYSILTLQSPESGQKLFREILSQVHAGQECLLIDCTQFAWGGFQESDHYGLSELIYYLCQEKRLGQQELRRAITHRDGMDCIHGVSQCMDLMEWKPDSTSLLLKEIHIAGYHKVCLIISALTESLMELVSKSTSILYVYEGRAAQAGEGLVKQHLTRLLPASLMNEYQEFRLDGERESSRQLIKAVQDMLKREAARHG